MIRHWALVCAVSTGLLSASAALSAPQSIDKLHTHNSALRLVANATTGSVADANSSNFDQLLQSQGPVVVEFGAKWCSHCKNMAPVLESLAAQQPNVCVARVDIDENPGLAQRFNVSGVPHIFVFNNGKVVDHFVGEADMSRLMAGLNKANMM